MGICASTQTSISPHPDHLEEQFSPIEQKCQKLSPYNDVCLGKNCKAMVINEDLTEFYCAICIKKYKHKCRHCKKRFKGGMAKEKGICGTCDNKLIGTCYRCDGTKTLNKSTKICKTCSKGKPTRAIWSPKQLDALWFQQFKNKFEVECPVCANTPYVQMITPRTAVLGHIDAIAKNGEDNLGNIIHICKRCNDRMGTRNIWVFRKHLLSLKN